MVPKIMMPIMPGSIRNCQRRNDYKWKRLLKKVSAQVGESLGDGADARQGQHDLHLLLELSGPAPSCRGIRSRLPNTPMHFSNLALFCCCIDKVRRILRSEARVRSARPG
jgi:hypothetical protein